LEMRGRKTKTKHCHLNLAPKAGVPRFEQGWFVPKSLNLNTKDLLNWLLEFKSKEMVFSVCEHKLEWQSKDVWTAL
jgi:hypothetical protein